MAPHNRLNCQFIFLQAHGDYKRIMHRHRHICASFHVSDNSTHSSSAVSITRLVHSGFIIPSCYRTTGTTLFTFGGEFSYFTPSCHISLLQYISHAPGLGSFAWVRFILLPLCNLLFPSLTYSPSHLIRRQPHPPTSAHPAAPNTPHPPHDAPPRTQILPHPLRPLKSSNSGRRQFCHWWQCWRKLRMVRQELVGMVGLDWGRMVYADQWNHDVHFLVQGERWSG